LRNLSIFYKTFITGLLIVLIAGVYLDYKESAVLSEFLSGAKNGSNILVNFERAQRDLTMRILDFDTSAEVFVMGSSHCYLFDKKYFKAPFINLSVTSGSMKDFAAFSDAILKRKIRPALVLIGIDYWALARAMFSIDAYDMRYFINYIKFASEAVENPFLYLYVFKHAAKKLREIFNYDLMKKRFSDPPFISSAKYFENCAASDVGYDLWRSIYKNIKVYDSTDQYRKNEAANHFSLVKSEFSGKVEEDADAKKILGSIIKKLKNSGAVVILFAPPFSFDEYELYKSEKKIFEKVNSFYSSIKKTCEENGAQFFEISNPHNPKLGLTAKDFFDAHHSTYGGTQKIMKYIYDNIQCEKKIFNAETIYSQDSLR